MAKSINLYQDTFNKKSKVRSVDVALYSVLAVLALTVGGFFLLKSMNVAKQSAIENIKQEATALTESVSQENLQTVNDQYLRFDKATSSTNDAESILSHFAFLEQSLVPEVTLKSYTFSEDDKDSMIITIASNFLDGASKQLTAFENSTEGVSVRVLSTTLEEGIFETEVSLTFNE